jgi:hypothetical protein
MQMKPQMLFVIGAPRSGTTMLERMLSAHSMVQGGPEPHLLTPLAHLGVWAKVDKAPYDHILAAQAQKGFVAQLPRGEADYWDACRAYCDTLYGRYMEACGGGREICLDKTPAYALILPFSSFANSFFDGDYRAANEHNPLINRYVPALAAFLRQTDTPHVHVRYEELVKDPETHFQRICGYIGIPYEAEAIDYGKADGDGGGKVKGLGDPIGVGKHTRPTTASVKKWVAELANDAEKRKIIERALAAVDPADLETIGYPPAKIWKPLEEAGDSVPAPKPPKLDRYRIERRLIVRLRSAARRSGLFRRLLEKGRLACDVLLRE